VSTHAWSKLPQWIPGLPGQNGVVPGPAHRHDPAQGSPQPIKPLAQVGTVVVVGLVVLVVVVVGAAAGAQSIFANCGLAVRVPNWS
jgi:hypothetical protein